MSCPVCQKEADPKYRPFCSRRCSDVDLGRWLNGSYAVPAEAPEDLNEAADALSQQEQKQTRRPH
ncbi:DNA gyrase inhibitor YacG [Aliiroseovarius sp. 2305UL8-7]|uniref:DNA gyrase inhibitor YacG n=1 Tax=Aliiroseovarius conchicola TaxID=3121637 RepID=UPI003529AB79